jgi:hypothetical protein
MQIVKVTEIKAGDSIRVGADCVDVIATTKDARGHVKVTTSKGDVCVHDAAGVILGSEWQHPNLLAIRM